VVGVDGVGRDQHPLEELVGVALEQDAVLEGAGLHLVGVGDQVLRPGRALAERHEAPLGRGGEAGAAAPTQAGVLDQGLHAARVEVLEHLAQRPVAAQPLVGGEVRRLLAGADVLRHRSLGHLAHPYS
jgi:hypothetical protein